MQIDEKKHKDKHERNKEKLYYKPHFGPEETMGHQLKMQEDMVN
jgi:hypothetical protein